MTSLSQTILDRWQVRKTRQQKTEFIEFMKSQFPALTVEEGGFGKNRNLVLGNVREAKVILTAHYDTCAQLPIPNFITPKSRLLSIGYGLLICLPLLIPMIIIELILGCFIENQLFLFLLTYLPFMGGLFWMLLGGKPNPHTANDNTSGVIQLIEILSRLPEAQRSQVAFVFFDNEENGLLGSSYFARLHKQDNLKDKLVLNFDCVSDGDHFLFVLKKPALARFENAFRQAFPATEEKTVEIISAAKAMYPSDQANFPTSAAVAALKKHRLLGLYMDKIHTKDDCVFDECNIDFLTEGTLRFLDAAL
jgi:hypothetical protein